MELLKSMKPKMNDIFKRSKSKSCVVKFVLRGLEPTAFEFIVRKMFEHYPDAIGQK